jgi:hypothetical protein
MAAAPRSELERENFDLRMRVYHMDQRLNDVLASSGATASPQRHGTALSYDPRTDRALAPASYTTAASAAAAGDYTPGIPPLMHRDALLLRAKDAISKLEVRAWKASPVAHERLTVRRTSRTPSPDLCYSTPNVAPACPRAGNYVRTLAG